MNERVRPNPVSDRAPLQAGECVDVVHYDPARGTVRTTCTVISCRLTFPIPADGRRWKLTYRLDGEDRGVIVGDDGTDRHLTVEPSR